MQDLTHIHEALVALRRDVLLDPRNEVEGLDGASCAPHVKHLAVLAAGASAEGQSAQQWRDLVAEGVGENAGPLLDDAEACMKESGLWPWPD